MRDLPLLARLRDRKVRWRNRLKAWRERQLFRIGEGLAALSTFKARKPLTAMGRPIALVDTSIFFHSVTHETAWISTGKQKWGGIHEFDSGYQTRIAVHDPRDEGRVYREVRYLVAIAELFQQGYLNLRTSAEIRAEMHRQPMGRFTGYGWQDLTILHWGSCPSIDGHQFDFNGDAKAQQIARVARCDDPAYRDLVALFGQKMSLDVFHIYTASKNKIPFFLHIDFPLADMVKQHRKSLALRQLNVEVLLPSQFGERFGLIPVPPIVLSNRGRKFSVRPDLHWPEGKRQRPRPKAK